MVEKVGDFGLAMLLIAGIDAQSSIRSTNVLKGSIGYILLAYGLGGKPSTVGDVYSFGIMLLEFFTGKNPTHDSIVEGLSLKKWVKLAFPTNMEQVVDPEPPSDIENLCRDDQSISSEIRRDYLKIIVDVALSCTFDSLNEHINLRGAYHKLKCVKEVLLKPNVT
ncbi:unnamed protein product [Ilex paraguariensis]|uniref:Protein kinase domain-containing protein n=1 Tax=Ilex paraguariensis TaxID=185542 RepID=A0ABC8UP84_9AQUA